MAKSNFPLSFARFLRSIRRELLINMYESIASLRDWNRVLFRAEEASGGSGEGT